MKMSPIEKTVLNSFGVETLHDGSTLGPWLFGSSPCPASFIAVANQTLSRLLLNGKLIKDASGWYKLPPNTGINPTAQRAPGETTN
jgi:hypothetical protein